MILSQSLIKYSALTIVIIFLFKIFMRFLDEKDINRVHKDFEIQYQSTWQVMLYIFCWFFTSRLLISVIVYYFHVVSTNSMPHFIDALKDIWYRWDSPHYISIAENWYSTSGDEKYFIVFYPLYPIFVRLMNIVVHNYFLSGVFVSNLFLIISLYYLYRLIEIEYRDKNIARTAVKYLLIFPFSFFFSIVYTESLFIALTIMCFYYARNKRFFLSGVCGMLASLTRNQGLLLVIPIIIEMVDETSMLHLVKKGMNSAQMKKLIKLSLFIILVPFGFILYLVVNKWVTGEWFKFLVYQKEHWYQSFGYFADNLEKHYSNIFNMEQKLALGIWVPQIVLFFLVFILLIYNINKMRLSYIIYSFLYIIISYSPTWLLSGPRYLTGMFTLYMMLTNVKYKYKFINVFVDFVILLLLCFYSIQFYLWNVY